MQSADQPAALPVGFVASTGPAIYVLLHLCDTEQSATGFVEDHGGQVMVKQGPSALSVGSSLKKNLEGIVPCHTDSAPPGMPQQVIKLRRPLRMSGAAQSETIAEETVPVFAQALVLALCKSFAPEVTAPGLAMPVMGIAPKPGSQRLAFVGVDSSTGDAFIGCSLGSEETLERGDGEFARVPGMVGANLGITNVCEDLGPDPKGHQRE